MRLLRSALYGLSCFAFVAQSAEYHVSPKGDDSATGQSSAPFATLLRARDAVRQLQKEGLRKEPVTVWVHGGSYEVSQPLVLEAQDSGSEVAAITYRAAPSEKPLLLGARKVEGFTPYQGSILKADVSALKLDKMEVRQLLFNGQRQPLARYPNVDPADPLYGGWGFLQEIPPGKDEGHKWKSEAYLSEKDVRHWEHPEDVEIDIFANYGWWNFIVPVKGIDPATRKLTLARDCGYDLHPYNRFHFQNALEELDAPGEWYLDKRTHLLYFWPPQTLEHQEVRLPVLDSFFRMKAGVKHVTVQGLAFQGCVGTAVVLENTEDCTVAACSITQCGGFNGSGISVNGQRNHVTGNDISYTGSTGIGLNGGDRLTLTAANNVADNNHIHHVGVLNKNGAGVGLGGCGNTVSHNLIHDIPRMGVQFGGNNLVIEYNHIHHTVLETQDGGALYTGGRDWISSRGTVIRYNWIHDTRGVGQEKEGLKRPFFTWGIYMDDNTGGVDILSNVIARSSRASLHLHNARDCVVENNVFVDGAEKELEYDGWNKEQHYIKDHLPTMIKGWESVHDQPAWKYMRGMEINPKDSFFPDGTMMSGDVMERNIIFWHDPSVRYVDFRSFKPEHNRSDFNVIWNGGQPVRTAVTKVGADEGEDLVKGAGMFRQEDNGKTPKGWGWNHRPRPELKITVQQTSLQVDAGESADPKASHSVIHGPNVAMKAGATYRAHFRFRSTDPETRADFSFGVFENGKGYWQTRSIPVSSSAEWQNVEVLGTMPRANEPQWKSWMKDFWLRMDVHGSKGAIQLADVTLYEAQALDGWAAWQSEGWDAHSIVADPLFQNEAADDYRLRPESPAWKQGFKAIPVEKIGPYADALRASWPIAE